MLYSFEIGDRVRWESAAGTIRGQIKSMRLARNAATELVAWLTIGYTINGREKTTSLCAVESNLKMLKFTKEAA